MTTNTDVSHQADTRQQGLAAALKRKPTVARYTLYFRHSPRSFKQLKVLTLIVAVLLSALAAGTGGYLLGIRNNQPTPPLHPSSSPQATLLTPILPTFVPLSNSSQSTSNYPMPTDFNPPASWKVYKSEFGYQYSYPPTWNHSPHVNGRSSGVSV